MAPPNNKPDPTKVARRSMIRTAGEVRFIKDKSNDASQWAWGDKGSQERQINPEFAFDPRNTKPLAKVLRSTNAAMGHAMSAYAIFTKIKSADVSPDGSLGGKGYVQKIAEMRRAYMNVIEALSAMSDTLYDEISAPHWAALSRQEDPEDRAEVEKIVEDAVEIKQDPEGWAEDQEEEMDEVNEEEMAAKAVKLASFKAGAAFQDTKLTTVQAKAFKRVRREASNSGEFTENQLRQLLSREPSLKGLEFGLITGWLDGDDWLLYFGPMDPENPKAKASAVNSIEYFSRELEMNKDQAHTLMGTMQGQWVLA